MLRLILLVSARCATAISAEQEMREMYAALDGQHAHTGHSLVVPDDPRTCDSCPAVCDRHEWYCTDARAELLPCAVWRARTAVSSDGKPTPDAQHAAAELLKQHTQEKVIEQMQDMHTAWCTEGLGAHASWLDRKSSFVCGDLSDEAEEIEQLGDAAAQRVWGGKGSTPGIGKGGAGGKGGASGRKGGKGAATANGIHGKGEL